MLSAEAYQKPGSFFLRRLAKSYPATRSIRVDSISGDLVWDTPADTGKYNVAMEIQEWRYGKKHAEINKKEGPNKKSQF